MLELARDAWLAMVGHCYDGLPLEACGLLAAGPDGRAVRCFPTGNAAASTRVYTVEPRDHLRADRAAEAAGLEIVGVFHSHTHTAPVPSPTDVAQAPDPGWHYVLVSLATGGPEVRSWRIVGGEAEEEPVVVVEAAGAA